MEKRQWFLFWSMALNRAVKLQGLGYSACITKTKFGYFVYYEES
jgi:hypothetical protein